MTIYRVENDTESPIEDTLTDDVGKSVNISGFNDVEIHIVKPDETVITDNTAGNVVVDDAENGHVSYDFQGGDLDQTGQYEYEWEVTFSDGGNETFPGRGSEYIVVRPERG